MNTVLRILLLLTVLFNGYHPAIVNAQYVEFETSWKSAKKKSKKSGKPIVAIFSHWKYNDINERYFDVDSIAKSLKKDFILYRHSRGKKKPWHLTRVSTVIVSDHKENKLKDLWYYYFKDNLIEEIRSYDKPHPLSYYQDLYKENKNDLAFLEEYVRYGLKYKLQLTKVYWDYFRRIEGFNCLKLECVTERIYHTMSLEGFCGYYDEMVGLDCGNGDINERLFFKFHLEYIRKDENDDERYSDYYEAASKTTEFLSETDRYRDSLIDYNTWRYHSKRKYDGYTKSQERKANSLLLKTFEYRIENIYTMDSIQSMLFDLSVTIDNKKELNELVDIIVNRKHFVNDAAILEILAVAYIRLDDKNSAAKMISRANEIAVKNKIRYRTIIPEMKKKGLLTPVKN